MRDDTVRFVYSVITMYFCFYSELFTVTEMIMILSPMIYGEQCWSAPHAAHSIHSESVFYFILVCVSDVSVQTQNSIEFFVGSFLFVCSY